MRAYLESEHYLVRLLSLDPREGGSYHFQNQAPGAISYQGVEYIYLPFNLTSSDRKLELDSPEYKLDLANIPYFRELVIANEGFVRAVATLRTIFPDRPDTRPLLERLQVGSVAFNQGAITFTLQSPLASVQGVIPSSYFDNVTFPELPVSNQSQSRA